MNCPHGLTKREYFAAQAMQTMIVRLGITSQDVQEYKEQGQFPKNVIMQMEGNIFLSLTYADILLKELDK